MKQIKETIKETKKDIQILALTVCAIKGEKEKCFKYGCDAYMSKPFNRKDLVHLIALLLSITKI